MADDTVSTTSLLTMQRDVCVARALRIVGGFAQGETPGTNAVSEACIALNALVSEFQTDGMPLWKISQQTITLTASNSYSIGLNATVNTLAPLKILQAWTRSTTTPVQDQPMLIVPYMDYNIIGTKSSTGQPNQLFYQTPSQTQVVTATGGTDIADARGTIFVYPLPDAYTIANRTLVIVGHYPFLSFNAATDVPDFPPYWNNALVWALAGDISFEYGVGPTDKAMIQKRADLAKQNALSFGTEEGSLFMRPTAHYESPAGSNTN